MTDSAQVTKEDVKTSTNKSSSKALKQSNDNTEHGKSSDKAERPLTKVVVRHLPPTMTLELFLEQVSPLPPVDYMYFVKADSSLGHMSFSRAYLNFVNVQDLIIFTEKFDNYVFIDAKGNEYPAIVEFAPFQRIPKQRSNRKKDSRAGTIENDPYYLDFVEALKAEEEQRKSVSKTNKQHFFETNTNSTATQKVTSTPLLEYLKARKLDKMRVKEDKMNEKKKRDLEKKKAREDRTSGRPGEGDVPPVKSRRSQVATSPSKKVVTPPHGRSDVPGPPPLATPHSPSQRQSEDKRTVREVKRRDEDRVRTREPKEKEETRQKDARKSGKSYQEERQKLNERRQAAKGGSFLRPDGHTDGHSEEASSSKSASQSEEVSRKPEKNVRSPMKASDPKKTPERPRRPEKHSASSSSRDTQKDEPRKKSYAQERELRKSGARKDSCPPEDDSQSQPSVKSSPKGTEKEKTDSSNKGKDPRAERRIRNKDRPSIEIYRPGMGRFSRQRLEREKGSIVGSSTERDSASPSPSPSPSVSRAASVSAKMSSHKTQPKSVEEVTPPAEGKPRSAATVQSTDAAAGSNSKTAVSVEQDDKSPKAEDAADEASDPGSESADIATKSADSVSKPMSASAQSEDKPTDSIAQSEDMSSQSLDSAVKSADTETKPADTSAADTGVESADTGVESGDTGVESADTGVESADTGVESADTGVESGDTGVESGDTGVESGDTGVESADTGVESADTGVESADTASRSNDTTTQSGDTASQTAASPADSTEKTTDNSAQSGDTAAQSDTVGKSEDSGGEPADKTVHSADCSSKENDSIKTEVPGAISKDAASS